jgi:hypothetical protein
MADDREPLGRANYEAQAAWQQEQPAELYWCSRAWEALSDEEREPFMRGASAVAVQAVADAGVHSREQAAEVLRLRARLLSFAAEANRRKWMYQDSAPEAFDALHRLGNEILEALGEPVQVRNQERNDEKDGQP